MIEVPPIEAGVRITRRELLKIFGVAFLVRDFKISGSITASSNEPQGIGTEIEHIMQCPECKREYLDFWFGLYRFLPMLKNPTREDGRYVKKLARHETYWSLVELYSSPEVELTLDERERLVGGLMAIRTQIAGEVKRELSY